MKLKSKFFLMFVVLLGFSVVFSFMAGAAEQKYGGVFKVALNTNPKILGYPAEVTNNGPLPFLEPILQSLGKFDEVGNLVPWLAESWEVDADAKTITFKLKKGIRFSDGTEFNAEAVKWNIEQYMEVKRNEVANIDSIEVIDDSTIRINLREWDSSNLEAIGFFVRYISPTAFKAHGKEWAYKNPVGTGPFLLDKWEMNVSISYKKNPNYYVEGEPKLDGLKMLIIEDPQTAASALRAGEIDALIATNIDIAKELIDSGQYDVTLHSNGIGAVGVGLVPDSVTEGSPFADVRVRKAMCYSIDADLLAKIFGKGYYTTTNQWGATGAITYNPNVVGYPYNPEKARQLLAEAGYPNGVKTKLFANIPFKDLFTAIQAQLATGGFDAELILCDEAKIQSMYFNTWEGGLMGHFHSVQPDLGLYMNRHLEPNGAFYAKGIIHPEDVLQLLKENQQAPNPEVKKETSMKLQKLVYDKYCIVGKPLYIPKGIFIKQKYVKDDGFHKTHASSWTPGLTRIEK